MKRPSLFNWKYIVLAILILAGAGGLGALALRWTAEKPNYEYLQAEPGPLRVTLRESATVEPEHRLTVIPPIPGRIDSVNVSDGDAVKAGQVLAWISSTDRAALMDAAAAAGGKETAFWQDVYKPAPLVAPLNGYIISTDVVPGQVITAAQAVFNMSDHLIIQANVDETDLEHVSLGQSVDITFDSYPGVKLTGNVHYIAYDATTVNNVTTYLVNIFLNKTPSYVRSGMSANVFLLVSDRQNVLRIPTDAITPEGEVLVATEKDAPPESQTVELGQSDGTWTEVISGLKKGDWIARPIFTVQQAQRSGFSFTSSSRQK